MTIEVVYTKGKAISENSDKARDLYNTGRFGAVTSSGQLDLSLYETLFLLERGTIILLDGKNKPITPDQFLKKACKVHSGFWVRYMAFCDLRKRGYIVKTALKFGADFRVYDKGVKPGEDHAKWIVFPVPEAQSMTWHDFSSKNRVAHSTKKKLLIAVVDDEGDVTYYEVRWLKP